MKINTIILENTNHKVHGSRVRSLLNLLYILQQFAKLVFLPVKHIMIATLFHIQYKNDLPVSFI